MLIKHYRWKKLAQIAGSIRASPRENCDIAASMQQVEVALPEWIGVDHGKRW